MVERPNRLRSRHQQYHDQTACHLMMPCWRTLAAAPLMRGRRRSHAVATSWLIVVLYCRRFVERREEGRRQGVVLSPAL